MSAPPYMQFYVGDYLSDTTHLSVTEHGAYLLLLMGMWRNGGSLPADDAKLAKFARCTTAQWLRVKSVVLDFFDLEDGQITQARLSAELQKYEVTLTRRSESGKASARAKALKSNNPPSTLVERMLNQPEPEPEPEKKERSKAKAFSPCEGDFDAFFDAYPNRVGKRLAAKSYAQALKRIKGPDPHGVIMAGIIRAQLSAKWLEGYIPNPATWLNQDRWEDQPNERPDRLAKPLADTDIRRTNTDTRRKVWAEIIEERDGLSARQDPEPERHGGNQVRLPGYPRLAHSSESG